MPSQGGARQRLGLDSKGTCKSIADEEPQEASKRGGIRQRLGMAAASSSSRTTSSACMQWNPIDVLIGGQITSEEKAHESTSGSLWCITVVTILLERVLSFMMLMMI